MKQSKEEEEEKIKTKISTLNKQNLYAGYMNIYKWEFIDMITHSYA